MGRRLSRFGHVLFGIALLMGLTLWLHFGFAGGWLHAKLLLVTLVFVFSIVIGRWLKAAEAGRPLPSARAIALDQRDPAGAPGRHRLSGGRQAVLRRARTDQKRVRCFFCVTRCTSCTA